MKASIITPCFNAAAFIEQCILNVAAQGDSVGEHIVVDGGSTDGTVEKVQAMMADHPRLRFIPGPDKGQSDAMNKGTLAAREQVIGFLNADDFYQPGAVAEGLRELETFDQPGVVIGDCRVIDGKGDTIRWNRPADLRLQKLVQPKLWTMLPANPSAYFYHRDVHDIVGGYDVANHYSMDVDFMLNAIRLTRIRYVPRHWGNFVMMEGGKSHDNADLGVDVLSPVLLRHRKFLTPLQRLSLPLFEAHTRLQPQWYRLKKRLGLIR